MMNDFANFDRAAEYYDETRGFPPGVDANVAVWLAETVGLSPESRLLEVGIGTGRIAVPLAAHVRRIVGVDISRAMMARIQQKSPAKPIDLAEADAQYLPFAANSFDVCLSVHVFHLIPDMDSCVREINRVLKPDGVLLYCGGPADASFADLEAVWDKHVPDNIGAGKMDDVQAILAQHGWQVPDEPFKYAGIKVQRRPQGFVEMMRQRKRSSVWRMTDEQLNAAVAELEAVMRQNYADPSAWVELDAAFYVGVYRRA